MELLAKVDFSKPGPALVVSVSPDPVRVWNCFFLLIIWSKRKKAGSYSAQLEAIWLKKYILCLITFQYGIIWSTFEIDRYASP